MIHFTCLGILFWSIFQIAQCGLLELKPPIGPYRRAKPSLDTVHLWDGTPLITRCERRYRNTTLDHFSWAPPPEGRTTYRQRYFVCDEFWKRPAEDATAGPIFFYVGNEADVTLYLNATGLLWESAPAFGALLVFAEHRYYGESKPYANDDKLRKRMQFLTSEQAMADYAELLTELKEELGAQQSAVVGFGGSYGGMLAAWMRLKFPHILDGAIASSAPIWSFAGEVPAYDSGSFAEVVTRDASAAGGSAPACANNVRAAWREMFSLGASRRGQRQIRDAMRLCRDVPLESKEDVEALAAWASNAFDYMAMGNYPYPSSYILNGGGTLPAYPVRAACNHLADSELKGPELLAGLASAVGLFYNYTGELACFDTGRGPNPETDADGDFWDYQYCTEMCMPFTRDGVRDMFWEQPFSWEDAKKACRETWGTTPRPMWATIEWGAKRLETLSNVVFANGLLDPWSGGGVLRNLSDSVVAILIPEGAHHIDLMFSNPLDPPSVTAARQTQREHIQRWVAEAADRKQLGEGWPPAGLVRDIAAIS